MPGSHDKPLQVEVESVRHLVELGYVDPADVAAQKAAVRRQLQADFDRALTLGRQNHAQDAVALLEDLSRRDPDWSAPRLRLAEIYYNAGRWDDAQQQLHWLACHGVEHPRLSLLAGGIALARRDFATALEELLYAGHVDPNLPSVNTLLGTTFLRLGRWDEAEDAFRRAIEQGPNDARARDGLATVYLKHGEYEDAADWALRAVEQDMRCFPAHYHLGLALMRMNRPDDALQALETSARLDPTRAAPYRWLARIAAEMLEHPARANAYRDRARETIRQRRAARRRPSP